MLVWLVGTEHTVWKAMALGALLTVVAGFAVPMTDHAKATFTVQTSRQYQISAPIDGFVEAVPVRLHQQVREGDVLARLDVASIEAERASLLAERHEALLKVEQARVERQPGEAALQLAVADRLLARIDLLDLRIEQSILRAPADGVVAEHLFEERIGGPVRRGETMLSLVPQDGMEMSVRLPAGRAVELAELESAGELPHVSLASVSHPGRRVTGQVTHISPLVETEEGESFVRVRVELEEPAPWVQPGAEGQARLPLGRRPAAVVLLRDTVQWLRMKLWI